MNDLMPDPALNLAPFGRWTLRDKALAVPASSTIGTNKYAIRH
jgi:hypothetical protein